MHEFPRFLGWNHEKKTFYCKICKKTVLAHEFWGDNQYFESLGLELHSSGTESVTFFGAQFSFGGRGTALECLPHGARPDEVPFLVFTIHKKRPNTELR